MSDPETSLSMRAGGTSLRRLPLSVQFAVRVRDDDQARAEVAAGYRLDIAINTFAADGDRISTRLGPDEWLLLGPHAEASTLAESIGTALADASHALVDIGHRHAAFELAGPRAVDMLNAGCPLDLDVRAFPTGSATRTLLGKAEIVLWRLSDAPAYRIECGRSFAAYVEAFLLEAGREYQ